MNLLVVNENVAFDKEDILLYHINNKFSEIEIEEIVSKEAIEKNSTLEAWNSVLMYRFDGELISEANAEIIKAFKLKTNNKGIILPVSYSNSAKPPGILSTIKANKISDTNAVDIISNRLASYLGILCLGKDHTVFISYRASDGKAHALEAKSILEEQGFNIFLDEARDIQGEGSIPIGKEAQEFIDKQLLKCSVLILIDTPDVTQSDYVEHEIEVANSMLIPILPVCFTTDGSFTYPRFMSLRFLHRFLFSGNMLNKVELISFLSDFLNGIYIRKKRISAFVEKSFRSAGYSWEEVDIKKLYFSSEKQKKYTKTSVLSHCPIHKGLFPPYVNNFSKYKSPVDFNFRFLIYEGELLNKKEIGILKNQVGAMNVEILHFQEVQKALEE